MDAGPTLGGARPSEPRDPSGGLDMGERARTFDWSGTPLGPIDSWPQSLRTAVGICLHSRFPTFVWWGPELTHIYNDAYAPILGQRHPAALGIPARQVWTELWPLISDDVASVVVQGETVYRERARLVLERNGYAEETFFTYSHSPILDDQGKIGGLFQVCFDETARVRAEQEQVRVADQRRMALDAANLGWWRVDPASGDVIYDERFREFFGFPPGDGRIDHELALLTIHPDDRARVDAAVKAATRPDDPRPYAIEYRIRHSSGAVRWVSAKGRAYYSGEGRDRRYTSFVGTIADVTDQKAADAERDRLLASERASRAEAERLGRAAAESERQYRLMVENVRDFAMFLTDTAGRLTHWNVGAERLLGWTEADVMGRPAAVIFTPEDRQAGAVEQEMVTAKRDGHAADERWHLRKDGSRFFAHGMVMRVDDEAGLHVGFTKVLRDVTERRRAEVERESLLASERTARAESERAGRIKDEFLATLGHELRTPLNAILGWATIIRGGNHDAQDVSQGMEIIERNARAQSQIIEDLLDMSRIISGKVRLDVQRLDLSAIVEAAVATARPTAEAKGVRLQSIVDPLQGTVVSGDANRLQQVLWNLLSNAVKFTPKGGRVQVLLERVNSHIEISVIDTGEGIRPEFLPYVFDRFRQADASTTRRHGGLGLGLSIVKQLVELHGGSVWVTSAGPGHGSTFIVGLPVTIMHPEADPDEERHHPRAPRRTAARPDPCAEVAGVRVLVIDDEADARSVVKRLLENCGAVVTATGSVDEVIRLVVTRQFDVLVSDIGMPGEDGYSLIRRVRALGKGAGGDIPSIALTAYARVEDRVRAVTAGFQMHVSKPVEAAELVAMVAGAAGRTGR